MSNQQIYFLKRQEIFIMGIKPIIISLIFVFSVLHNSIAEVIYNKNGIIITSNDIKNYIEIYNKNQNEYLSNEIALKKLVLNKSLISSLEKNNPKLYNYIEKKLISIMDKNKLSAVEYDFYRFRILKNEFLSQYFIESFNRNEFIFLINNSDQINIPLSKNSCLTIHEVINLRENKFIIEILFENLKNNDYQNQFKIGNNDSVCMSNKIYKYIEILVLKYIEKKTNNEFLAFLYKELK